MAAAHKLHRVSIELSRVQISSCQQSTKANFKDPKAPVLLLHPVPKGNFIPARWAPKAPGGIATGAYGFTKALGGTTTDT